MGPKSQDKTKSFQRRMASSRLTLLVVILGSCCGLSLAIRNTQGTPTLAEKYNSAVWLRDQILGGRANQPNHGGLAEFQNRDNPPIIPAGHQKLFYAYIIGNDPADGALSWAGKWRSVVETDQYNAPTGRYGFIRHPLAGGNNFDYFSVWGTFYLYSTKFLPLIYPPVIIFPM